MSKSMTWCKNHYKTFKGQTLNYDIAKERTTEKYFRFIVRGENTKIVPYKDGSVAIKLKFDRNRDGYNMIQCWSEVDKDIVENMDDILKDVARDFFGNPLQVPAVSPTEPYGGQVEPGDLTEITLGNLVIINDVHISDGTAKQTYYIMLPYHYERIPGGYGG